MNQCLLCDHTASQAFKAIFTQKGFRGRLPFFTVWLCQDCSEMDDITGAARAHLEQVMGPFNKFRLRFMRLARAFKCVRLDSRPLPKFSDLEPGTLFFFNNWGLESGLCEKDGDRWYRCCLDNDINFYITGRAFSAARVIPAAWVLSDDEIKTLPDYVLSGNVDFTKGIEK